MSLEKSLDKRLSILEQIDANDGVISPGQENYLEKVEKEVTENIDRFVRFIKVNKQEIDQYKKILQALVSRNKKKIQGLEDFYLKPILKKHGKLETPISYIALRDKEVEKVEIFDFDLVYELYPECTTIETKDNVRKITLNKTELKRIFKEKNGEVKGFLVKKEKTQWVDARYRV